MNNFLGVVVSIILFGFFLLIMMSLNENVLTSTYQSTFDKNNQQDIVDLVDLLNFDFLKIGHRKTNPKFKVGSLDSNNITWYSDFDNNNSMDSVSYFLQIKGDSKKANPNVRYLYRKINNGTPLKIGVGIVRFKLTYYDSSGTQISYNQLNNISKVNKIRAIKVQIRSESLFKYNKDFSRSLWEKTFTPRSLTL